MFILCQFYYFIVLEPLKIIQQPGREYQLVTVDDGTTLNLVCVAEGLPPPSYQWYLGNVELPLQTESTLTIPQFL